MNEMEDLACTCTVCVLGHCWACWVVAGALYCPIPTYSQPVSSVSLQHATPRD